MSLLKKKPKIFFFGIWTLVTNTNFLGSLIIINWYFKLLLFNTKVYDIRLQRYGKLEFEKSIFLSKQKGLVWINEKLASNQCLGSGSVGSARFWLPGSGSGKICGSTDPDSSGKISTKNCKKKLFSSQNSMLDYWEKKYCKTFLISEWFIKF